MEKTMNLLIGGEAGQGLLTVGMILAKSLVRAGYRIVVTQTYQSRIRGGHNTFAVRISQSRIVAPQESIDLLVALNDETVELHNQELATGGAIIADEAFAPDRESCLAVPFKELASKRYVNTVALGAAASVLGLPEKVVVKALEDALGAKHTEAVEENRQILQKTFSWVNGQPAILEKLPPIQAPPARMMIKGNEAIALGALSAGLQFYSFYPMTPSTSISMSVIQHADSFGTIVEQAEDEISAINMAIGASFAGSPAMVGTAGGGFALMSEGVSLAAMTETPLVIAVAQRPAPATGMPTHTEQADLEFVLHSGHGEFPRAIFAPGSPEECFHLTRKAFQLAEDSQGPVFILTDQFLADSYRTVLPSEMQMDANPTADRREADIPLPYRRYEITESGVSPRLLPGMSKHLVVADSDEHSEDGHISEDHDVRTRMVQKRLRKSDLIRREVVPPQFDGDAEPDLLLVSWGSSKGSVSEAAEKLRAGSHSVATLHFSQVWPLIPQQFSGYLQAAGQVVCVESNATGQFARLIRRETGIQIGKRVLRYDGLPITPEFIVREIGLQERE